MLGSAQQEMGYEERKRPSLAGQELNGPMDLQPFSSFGHINSVLIFFEGERTL